MTVPPSVYGVATMWTQGHAKAATAAMKADEELVAKVRAEIARLEAAKTPRPLLDPDKGDEVSRRVYRALTEVLAASEA